jgi:hypothetical protein
MLLAILVFAVVVGVIWLLARVAIDLVRRWRQRRGARGARRIIELGAPTGQIGTIAAGRQAPDPVGGVWCAAFGIELATGSRTMLRDATTLGFDVALDSGQRVRVPPGPCVLDMAGAAVVRDVALEPYLASIDPQRGSDPDPFPCDRARVLALRAGDRVELLCRLVWVADAAARASYREPAAILVPEGVVQLRKC